MTHSRSTRVNVNKNYPTESYTEVSKLISALLNNFYEFIRTNLKDNAPNSLYMYLIRDILDRQRSLFTQKALHNDKLDEPA